ncbi:MAG TPA: Ig-like domain-containing protein [Candidatus Limnocylindrales bacterium]|nr:Ig-like domain-containing protein [Candidatus Limnocylindrales bacterium]
MGRVVLVLGVAILGAGVLFLATGGLARAIGALGASVGGIVDHLGATPAPTTVVGPVSDSPLIEPPAEPYTNQAAIDLVVVVPTSVVGNPANHVFVYGAAGDAERARIADIAMGATPRVIVPHVALKPGTNTFTATVSGPAGESESSPVVTFVLDTAKPKIVLSGPRNGSTVNRASVTITGKTQARSAVQANNDANGASGNAVAAADGGFAVAVPLVGGSNRITLTATDPAGNVGTLAVTYKRGTGALSAKITGSAYRFSRAKLPDPLELTVLVTDPDGAALAGARVTFSVTIPGVGPITADRVSGSDGRASFRTTVPKGASVGSGIASVFVRAGSLGTASARTVLTVTK